jgi:hypothetical protein
MKHLIDFRLQISQTFLRKTNYTIYNEYIFLYKYLSHCTLYVYKAEGK